MMIMVMKMVMTCFIDETSVGHGDEDAGLCDEDVCCPLSCVLLLRDCCVIVMCFHSVVGVVVFLSNLLRCFSLRTLSPCTRVTRAVRIMRFTC